MGRVRLLVAPTDLQVQSQQLPFLREEVIGTQTYNTYGGSMELLAQDVISYDVKWNTGAVAIPFIPTPANPVVYHRRAIGA
jgi:hypothetical protein